MKKVFFTVLLSQSANIALFGQCTANYTYFDNSDSIVFQNLSLGTNNHFYWNFGDGSGSNAVNPLHVFPGDGEYLVTLYVHDLVTDCSAYVQNWITVDKIDTFACQLLLSYDVYNCGDYTCLLTTDLSSNCSSFYIDCDAAHGLNSAWDIIFANSTSCPALFLDRIQAYSNIPPIGYKIEKEYYKTFPYQFDPSVNYQPCSANFEIITEYQDSGALVTFTAMNQNATSYEWIVTGFGQPIYYYTPIATHFYPYFYFERYMPWMVYLRLYDATNNCGDTVIQQILIKSLNYEHAVSVPELKNNTAEIKLYPNPTNGQFTLEFDAKQSTNEILYLTDALGNDVTVYQLDIHSGKNSFDINLESLANGIYYLRFGERVIKLVKG